MKNQTEILTRIKANNNLALILNELEQTIEKMYNPVHSENPADKLVYKDKDGNEFDMYEFYDNLHTFIWKNQDHLKKDTFEFYKQLNRIK